MSFVLTRFFPRCGKAAAVPEPLTSFLQFLQHIRRFLTGIKFYLNEKLNYLYTSVIIMNSLSALNKLNNNSVVFHRVLSHVPIIYSSG